MNITFERTAVKHMDEMDSAKVIFGHSRRSGNTPQCSANCDLQTEVMCRQPYSIFILADFEENDKN